MYLSRRRFEKAFSEALRVIDPSLTDQYIAATVDATMQAAAEGRNLSEQAAAITAAGDPFLLAHAEQVREAVARAALFAYGATPSISTRLSATKDVMETPWNSAEMNLSARLHGSATAVRVGVVLAIQDGFNQYRTGRSIAQEIYTGYGSRNDAIPTAQLPGYVAKIADMANDIAKMGDPYGIGAKKLAEQLWRYQRQISKLAQGGAPTANLKAAYAEIARAAWGIAGAAEKVSTARLQAAVYTAVNERSRYYAQRIERTEIARAIHDGFIAGMAADKNVVGWRWRLGSRHAKIDVCDFHAKANLYGLGPGVYPKHSFPPLPAHPNCMCHAEEIYDGELDFPSTTTEIPADYFKQAEMGGLVTKAGATKYLDSLTPQQRRELMGVSKAAKYEAIRAKGPRPDFTQFVNGWKDPAKITYRESRDFASDLAQAWANDKKAGKPSNWLSWGPQAGQQTRTPARRPAAGSPPGGGRPAAGPTSNDVVARHSAPPANPVPASAIAAGQATTNQTATAAAALAAAAKAAKAEQAAAAKAARAAAAKQAAEQKKLQQQAAAQARAAAAQAKKLAADAAKAAAAAAKQQRKEDAERAKRQAAEAKAAAKAAAAAVKKGLPPGYVAGTDLLAPGGLIDRLMDAYGGPGRGFKLMDEIKAWIKGEQAKNYHAHYSHAYINHLQGFDGLPQVFREAEFDNLMRTRNYMESYRGVYGNDKDRAGHIENFKRGYFFAGHGVHGWGTYSAVVGYSQYAKGNEGWHKKTRRKQYDTANSYSGRNSDSVMNILIPRKAKIIDEGVAQQEFYNWSHNMQQKIRTLPTDLQQFITDNFLDDFGMWAAMKGYDMIRSKNGNGFGDEGYNVTFNRTAILVQEEAQRPIY